LAIINLAVNIAKWSASYHDHSTPDVTALSFPLDRKVGGPQNELEHSGEKKNLIPMTGIGAWFSK
jgi:hypothetical protein